MNRWIRPILLATVLAPGAALADSPFILPSSTSLSGSNNVVTFDAAASDHLFFFDHRPVRLDSIAVTRPDGTPAEPADAVQGRFRSVFDVKLDQPGTWKVVSTDSMITGTFKENGEERRVGGRGGPPRGAAARPAGEGSAATAPQASQSGPRRQPPVAFKDIPANATDVHLTEVSRTTETFVTVGAPTTEVLKPAGKGLEFDPITHPNSLAAGETARFRFLIDGKPAAGLKVTVIPGGDRYREDEGAMALTTGADGVVAITWPAAGMYWVGAEAEDHNPAEKRAEARRMSCAVTLEVMTP